MKRFIFSFSFFCKGAWEVRTLEVKALNRREAEVRYWEKQMRQKTFVRNYLAVQEKDITPRAKRAKVYKSKILNKL